MTETVLDRIKAYKLEEIKADKQTKPLALVEEEAKAAEPQRGFYTSLRAATTKGYGLIAEIKKASPSKGLIRHDFDRIYFFLVELRYFLFKTFILFYFVFELLEL